METHFWVSLSFKTPIPSHPNPTLAGSRPRLLRAELTPASATPPRPQFSSCGPPANKSTTSSTPLTRRPRAWSRCWSGDSTPCRLSAFPATSATRWGTAAPRCWVREPAPPFYRPRPWGRVGVGPAPWVLRIRGGGPAVREGAACPEPFRSWTPGVGAGASPQG